MASLAYSLRHLLGRGQPSTRSTPDSITCFDGVSDSQIDSQETPGALPQQQNSGGGSETGNGSATPLRGQCEAAGRDHAYQSAVPHQCSQPTEQFAVQQGGDGRNNMHGTIQPMQDLEPGGHRQYVESTRQELSRTATVQPPQASLHRFHVNSHPNNTQFPKTASHASTEVQVMQEPAVHVHDDRDIFAEFTNEEFYNEDTQMSAETQQAPSGGSKCAEHTAPNALSIKQKPVFQGQLFVNATERAEANDFSITTNHNTIESSTAMADQTQAAAVFTPQVNPENGMSTCRIHSEPGHVQSQDSSSMATHADGFQHHYSFQQYAQDPQQSISDPHAPPGDYKSLRSPSADSVIGPQRHSSEETVSSLDGMDLTANAQLIEQQWKERYKLLGMGPLTAEAVHATTILLHGPRPTQEQYGQSAAQPRMSTRPSNSVTAQQAQHILGSQRSSNFPYSLNVPYPPYLGSQYGQAHSHWMSPGSVTMPLMQHAPVPGFPSTHGLPPQSSMDLQRITEVQEKATSKASDDDEPLVTRAPRHRSRTASPIPQNAPEPANSSLKSNPASAASKPDTSNVKQDSVIELSDDGNEESVEAISWKLPDFEVTYHPPATDKDLPMAKVSILGHPKNLVRSEVALTEDHAQQEMELFLNVFLPNQQALQTPDPEPAHAVINFHTISVMVLEAFVQYEIGDEMGRGYGFHGGNIANQTLRPSPSSSDGEPTRTRSAKDADIDEIFFAVIDRWRAGLISGKGTLKLIRGCQEFCDIALDVIHYVKENGLSQPEPKKRKERSDKGVARGPRGGAKETETKGKATNKRKADATESKAPATKGAKASGVTTLQPRKKAKVETKKKTKPKTKPSGVTVTQRKK